MNFYTNDNQDDFGKCFFAVLEMSIFAHCFVIALLFLNVTVIYIYIYINPKVTYGKEGT